MINVHQAILYLNERDSFHISQLNIPLIFYTAAALQLLVSSEEKICGILRKLLKMEQMKINLLADRLCEKTIISAQAVLNMTSGQKRSGLRRHKIPEVR